MKKTLSLIATFGIGTMLSNAAVSLTSFNSATAPTIASEDFGYVEEGASSHAGNLWDIPSYVVGQTFTTGDNATGYELHSISFQINADFTDRTSVNGLQFITRIGTVSGSTFTDVSTQTTAPGATVYSGTRGNWFTLSFSPPITLAADTTYGAGVGIAGGHSEQGFLVAGVKRDVVSGMSFLVGELATDTTITSTLADTLDLKYSTHIATIPEPGTYAVFAGILGLGYVMIRRRRKVGRSEF